MLSFLVHKILTMHLHFIMVVHCSNKKKITICPPPKEFKMKKLDQTHILGQIMMKFGISGSMQKVEMFTA